MKEEYIDLSLLFNILMKKKKIVILLLVIGLVIGNIFAAVEFVHNNMDQRYEITTSLAITSENKNGSYLNNAATPGYYDVQVAEDLVSSVIYVASSDRAIQEALDKSHIIGIDPQTIREHLVVEQHDESMIITMTLYWENSKEGIQIVEALSEAIPDVLVETLNLGSVTVVDFAKNNGLDRHAYNVLYGLAFALVLAGLYLAIELLKKIICPTITSSDYAEEMLQVDCLGSIPDHEGFFNRKPYGKLDEGDKLSNVVWEILASVAFLVKHMFERDGDKCYYLTSSIANEGKTSVGANLALQLSLQGKKVLMIDFDIRRPNLGLCFFDEIDHEHSLNAVFEGTSDVHDVILPVNKNLDIIATRIEKNKILMEKSLLDKLRPLKEEYDIVLIDTAPIGMVSDTLMLNDFADKAIMVIRYDFCGLAKVRDSITRLNKSGLEVCGTILNSVQREVYDRYSYNKAKAYNYNYVKNKKE